MEIGDGLDEEDDRTALRSALAHAVGTICEAERGRGLAMEPEAVSTLAFVVEQYAKSAFPASARTVPRRRRRRARARARRERRRNPRAELAADLPAFAAHARRSTVSYEDVLLVARNNPDVSRRLNDFVDEIEIRKAPPKKRGRKKKAAEDEPDDEDGDSDSDALECAPR